MFDKIPRDSSDGGGGDGPQSESGPGTDYGEVFTKQWVVEFILDLVGYTPDKDLTSKTIVEPSCGTGAFLGPIVCRLLDSASKHGVEVAELAGCVKAFDVLEANAARARKGLVDQLTTRGAAHDRAEALAESWVVVADFLLHDHVPQVVDYAVGNPPYIRLESIPPDVMAEYRRRCPTMRGRSDIYVGFIEAALRQLRPGGVLGFICADRWMRNKYGADLRELITTSFAVDTVVSMHDVDAFEEEVSAYPAVVVVRNGPQRGVNVVEASRAFDGSLAHEVVRWTRNTSTRCLQRPYVKASRARGWFTGRNLWPSGTPEVLELISDLENRFRPLEDPSTGTRVGIGVATGCDEVFITSNTNAVEQERLLPLLRALDTSDGSLRWSGKYLVNPWDENGLVNLQQYPLLGAYLAAHAVRLRQRHVARRRPDQWYRTIDRVASPLMGRKKLVIPDLKARANPVLDAGGFYPHHNLYFVVSDTWDLEVLGGLLLSDITNAIVGAYCVRMRGACCRFQAQYLRRVRVPDPGTLSSGQSQALRRAFRARDIETATAIAEDVYGVTPVRYL